MERDKLAFELFAKRFAQEDFNKNDIFNINVTDDEIIKDLIKLSFKAADKFREFAATNNIADSSEA